MARRPAGSAARAAAARAGDTAQVTFRLLDVRRQLLRDPEGVFTFRRQKDWRQIAEQAKLPVRGTPIRFDIPAAGEIARCDIDLQRYRFAYSPLFMRAAGNAFTFGLMLRREPDEWRQAFTPWGTLSDRFEPLRAALGQSQDIAVLDTELTLRRLDGPDYDGVAEARTVLAKATLLNVHYRLRTAGPTAGAAPWFSHVQQVIAIGQERVLAYVTPEMAQLVRDIRRTIGDYDDRYELADASLHRKNVPKPLQPDIDEMFSIKSTHHQGNYQLTLTTFKSSDAILLDADIDESGTFWGHARDLAKHIVTGGTHPVDVYEILEHQDHQNADFDLGYTLV